MKMVTWYYHHPKITLFAYFMVMKKYFLSIPVTIKMKKTLEPRVIIKNITIAFKK